MLSSVIPARLEFQCGHAALVTLPRVKGETPTQRNERVAREKSAALARQCDFCGPTAEVAPVAAESVLDTLPVNGSLTTAEPAAEASVEVVLEVPVEEGTEQPVVVAEALFIAPPSPMIVLEPVIAVEPPADAAPVATSPVVRARRARRQKLPLVEVKAGRRFLVHFQGERVLRAANIRDAMRQANALGASDILAITRES